jgi:hypothetical protein
MQHELELMFMIDLSSNIFKIVLELDGSQHMNQSDGGGNNAFNLSNESDANFANSHRFSSCKHDLKIAIFTTQCFPAALSILRTLNDRGERIVQCHG